MNICLWREWFRCVWTLRSSCTRGSIFVKLVLVLVGFSVRTEQAGVTSFIRGLGLQPRFYHRLLDVFHSEGLKLESLTTLWVTLALKIFKPVSVNGYLVLLGDGIKIPKDGKKMPGVKKLHQSSGNSSKPSFIMGHSFQAISMLVHSAVDAVTAVPLTSRIHEGVVLKRNDNTTLLDKMVSLFLMVVKAIRSPVVFVVDAYYASRKVIRPLLAQGHHLVTRVRITSVAFLPAPPPAIPRRGRPKLYGAKLRLRDLVKNNAAFTCALSPVYGETDVLLEYRCLDLLWRPIGRLVRFVIVKHPTRGTIILMSTHTLLSPLDIISLYGYRFKIETGFRQAVHVIGSYSYHFWMKSMSPINEKTGNQHIYNKSKKYQQAVLRKLNAYHCFVQIGCIAQGLLQHLSINFSSAVWKQFRSWLRTMKPDQPPSELVVSYALRAGLFDFLAATPAEHTLKIIIKEHLDPSQWPEYRLAA